jgi:hypothetical protein
MSRLTPSRRIGRPFVGGFTPLISLTFLQQSNGTPWGVAAFLAAVAVLSFGCAAMVRSARP